MRRSARSDDSDRVMVPLLNFAPNVKNNRRRMDFAQRLGILRRSLSNYVCSKIFDSFELGRKIDHRFPVRNLVDDFFADSFNLAKLITLSAQNSLRLFKNLEQL